MEVGGRGTLTESVRALRIGGHIALIGILAEKDKQAIPELNMTAIVGNAISLRGISVGSRDMLEKMCAAIDLHRIKPVIGRSFHWTDIREALSCMAAGEHFGKIVLSF